MFTSWKPYAFAAICIAFVTVAVAAQESAPDAPAPDAPAPDAPAPDAPAPDAPAEPSAEEAASESAVERNVEKMVEGAQGTMEGIAEEVDRSEQAQEISAGVLKPIYVLAEFLSFPAVHWVAFAIMVTGVVSYALQLVLAKLVVLAHFGFSLREILADALGLVISLVGLVLTTQAAAENSTFTQSPAAVISATVAGVVVGFVFYLWGQAQEVQAVKGRNVQQAEEAKRKEAEQGKKNKK